MATLTTSAAGLALIKESEGFRPQLYNCPAGHATIGYGHLVHRGAICGDASERPFEQGISEDEGEALLRSDVRAKAEHYIRLAVRVELNQNQFDALASLVYNIGGGAFTASTLLEKLNQGDHDGAAAEFARWNKSGGRALPGLTVRRAKEWALFKLETSAAQTA